MDDALIEYSTDVPASASLDRLLERLHANKSPVYCVRAGPAEGPTAHQTRLCERHPLPRSSKVRSVDGKRSDVAWRLSRCTRSRLAKTGIHAAHQLLRISGEQARCRNRLTLVVQHRPDLVTAATVPVVVYYPDYLHLLPSRTGGLALVASWRLFGTQQSSPLHAIAAVARGQGRGFEVLDKTASRNCRA